MAISFKSVGKTIETLQKESLKETPTPIGIKTPLRVGESSEGLFAMHFSLADQIHDNLRNLILTNWGERLGSYDFGANLKELTTEYASREDFDNEAVVRINSAVSKWMPFVSLNEFEPQLDQENAGNYVRFKITYDIPILNVVNKALEIVLRII